MSFRGPAILFTCITTLMSAAAHAQDASAVKDAVRELTSEALKALADQWMPTAEPDFAGRFDRAPDPDELLAAIFTRAHKNDFVDAYIRWQLTSFKPKLPDLDDRTFLRVMNSAPKMLENPRANAQTVDLFERAKGANVISAADQQRLSDRIARLDRDSMIAGALNMPSLGFRDWVAKQLPAAGPRRRQWLLENCAATIQAGWPTRAIKTKISREFTASLEDESFTPKQRFMVAEQAKRLVGMKRRLVNKAAMTARGRVQVSFSTAGVTKKDVEKWTERILGVRAPSGP